MEVQIMKFLIGLIAMSAVTLTTNAESKVRNFNHNDKHKYDYKLNFKDNDIMLLH